MLSVFLVILTFCNIALATVCLSDWILDPEAETRPLSLSLGLLGSANVAACLFGLTQIPS